MNWKKNVFSYILWVMYAVAAAGGALGLAGYVCDRMNYPVEYGVVISMGYLPVAGLLVFVVEKLRNRFRRSVQGSGILTGVLEGLCVVFFLAMGVYLRLESANSFEITGGMNYYEIAQVAEGQGIPQVVHGATYLYLQLLHMVLLIFGNKMIAAVGLQLVLQMVAMVIFYSAVRRVAGRLAGIFTLGFLMLSPYMISSVLELSPAYLLLAFLALALFFAGVAIAARRCVFLWCALAGILTGVVCYLDISGVILLTVFASVFTLDKNCGKGFLNSRISAFLFGVAGILAGFFGTIGVDAGMCGKSFSGVLSAWAKIYVPGSFSVPFSMTTGSFSIDAVILFVVLVPGIFVFWYRKGYERQDIWVAMTAVLILLQCLRMMEQNAGSMIYIYIFLAALAGTVLESMFMGDSRIAIKGAGSESETKVSGIIVEDLDSDAALIEDVCRNLERAEQAALEAQEEAKGNAVKSDVSAEDITLAEHTDTTEHVEITESTATAEKIETTEQPRKVQFLENPLPLPKKHEPKKMDYRLDEMPEGDGYDYAVAEDDDFDI